MSKERKQISDLRVVATSVSVSTADVLLNLIVATITGSTVMLSQALQGLSDLITGGVILYGIKRSRRGADKSHPLGYGREIFFWVLIAGFFMFFGTGLVSVISGWSQVVDPSPVENIWLALGMLCFGFISNGWAFSLSIKRLHSASRRKKWWMQLLKSSFVETKATFIVDFLGTLAAILGIIALGLYIATNNPIFDGIGSIAIGLSMMAAALFLIYDIHQLIIGRSPDAETEQRISRAILAVANTNDLLDLRVIHIGSNKLFVVAEVHFQDGLTTDEIEQITDTIKANVIRRVKEVSHIQIEVETPDHELISR